MKATISKSRGAAGVLLIECLVYIAVFSILTGIGLAAFYLCWDHSKALVYATEDIRAALLAGERWRADVRHATGTISREPLAGGEGKTDLETAAAGEVVRLPEADRTVVYRFADGAVRREIPALHTSELLLARVTTSQMTTESRAGVTAWRWELELRLRRSETQLPLLFTFEAAQTKP